MAGMRYRSNVAAVEEAVRAALVDGLGDAGRHVRDVSRKRAPTDEGDLAASGSLTVDAADLRATISYDTPYAVKQHEDLTLKHDDGTAKYLEGPLYEEARTVRKLIAAPVRRVLR